ncbi:hypothetical protein ACFL1O_00505 [Patescibacteria group bacterium]
MLKKLEYKTASPRSTGIVVYAVLKNKCVIFSGITSPGSTINFAEEIIESIAAQEKIKVTAYRWFDLQTHRGYKSKEPGNFDFDELILVPGHSCSQSAIHAEAWRPQSIPREVVNLFKKYIGERDASLKIWTPEDAKQAGYLPTDMHSPTPGNCFDLVNIHNRQRAMATKIPLHLRGITAQFVSPSIIEDWIVVNEENRYCLWQRDATKNN